MKKCQDSMIFAHKTYFEIFFHVNIFTTRMTTSISSEALRRNMKNEGWIKERAKRSKKSEINNKKSQNLSPHFYILVFCSLADRQTVQIFRIV